MYQQMLLVKFFRIFETDVRPACLVFLEIALFQDVCVYVCKSMCPLLRLLMTSDMIWHDMDPV